MDIIDLCENIVKVVKDSGFLNQDTDIYKRIDWLATILGVLSLTLFPLIVRMGKYIKKIIFHNIKYTIGIETTEDKIWTCNYLIICFEILWIPIWVLIIYCLWWISYVLIYYLGLIVQFIFIGISILPIFLFIKLIKINKKLLILIINVEVLFICSVVSRIILNNPQSIIANSCFLIFALFAFIYLMRIIYIKCEFFKYNFGTKLSSGISMILLFILIINSIYNILDISNLLDRLFLITYVCAFMLWRFASQYKKKNIIIFINKSIKAKEYIRILNGGLFRYTDIDGQKNTILTEGINIIEYEENRVRKRKNKGYCLCQNGVKFEFNKSKYIKDEWVQFSIYGKETTITRIIPVRHVKQLVENISIERAVGLNNKITACLKLLNKRW